MRATVDSSAGGASLRSFTQRSAPVTSFRRSSSVNKPTRSDRGREASSSIASSAGRSSAVTSDPASALDRTRSFNAKPASRGSFDVSRRKVVRRRASLWASAASDAIEAYARAASRNTPRFEGWSVILSATSSIPAKRTAEASFVPARSRFCSMG